MKFTLMKTIRIAPALALLVAHTAFAQSAALNKNIFPEGTFDVFGESRFVPLGWDFPNRNDTPWMSGFTATVVKGESGSKELKLVNPDSGGVTMVGAKFTLPPKVASLRVSFRLLAKVIEPGEANPAGNGAGIYVRIYDASGNVIPGSAAGWVGGLANTTNPAWVELEQVYPMPENAATLELQVMFRNASGEVRIDDVKVTPLSVAK